MAEPRIRRGPNGEYYLTKDDGETFDRILNPREVKAGISDDGYVIPRVAKQAQAALGKENVPQYKIEAPLTLGQKAGRILAGQAPVIGGALGSEGGFPGVAAGSIAGTLAKQGLQKINPEIYGQGPESGVETALDIGGNVGMNYGIPKISNLLADAFVTKDPVIRAGLLRFFDSGKMPPEVRSVLGGNQRVPISMGQAADSPVLRTLENITAHGPKESMIDEQQLQLRDIARRKLPLNISKDFSADITKNNLADAFYTLQNEEKAAWDAAKSGINAHTLTVTKPAKNSALATAAGLAPKTKTETVTGPIQLDKAQQFAQKLMKQIHEKFGTTSAKDLETRFNAEERQALQYLDDIAKTKDPVAFEALHNIKEFLGDRAYKGQLSNLASTSSEQGIFKKLNTLIDDDIEQGIQKLPNGSDLLNKFKTAKELSRRKYEDYLEHPTASSLLKSKLSGISEMETALKDPAAVQHLIKTSSNPQETKDALGGEFLQSVLDSGFNKATKKYTSSSEPFNVFNSRENDPIIRSLFSNPQRQEINKLLKTMSYLDPKLPSSGMVSFNYNAAKSGAILAPALMGALFGGGELARSGMIAGTVLGGMLSARSFAKNILMNPRAVRLATELAKMPPQSKTAQNTAQALFSLMKGSQIYLTTPDHEKIIGVGTINDKGKIKVDSMIGGSNE